MQDFLIFVLLVISPSGYAKESIDSGSIEYLAMEMRSALNYQTECIMNVMKEFGKVLRDELVSNEAYPKVLSVLQEVGAIKKDSQETKENMRLVLSQLSDAMATINDLKKDVRRLKKESKAIKSESTQMKSSVEQEMKKLNVYFDAVRDTEFLSAGNLTFTAVTINEGNGMNITSGIFTTPVCGTYYFTFHANTVKGNDGLILLRHNGEVVAGAFDTDNFKHNTLAQAALVSLKKGDLVWIDVLSGGVRSNDNKYIHFIGILIKPTANC